MAWYETLTALLPAAFVRPFVRDEQQDRKALSREQLQNAEAYVDPSRLVSGWKIQPYNPSWLVTRKGMAIFDQMRRDEQVKAAMQFKIDSVVGTGWEVVSPGSEEDDWEPTRFVQDVFQQVEGGFQGVLVRVLSALYYGFSVHERIYAEQETGKWKGRLVLSKLNQLKPHWIDFAVDEFGVLHAIRQQLVGNISGVSANGLVGKEMPPAKFVIYSYRKEFGNWYGTSDLESVYRSWWTKDNAYKWLAVTLERFGMPPLFAMYDPNYYQGNQVEELKKVVKNIQNATLGVLPRPTAEALELWSQQIGRESTNLFITAINVFDQHIARGVLVPSAVGMSAETGAEGSLARSQQHFDSFMRTVDSLRLDLANTVINAQIIPQLCDLNFQKLEKYPVFRFLPFTDSQRLQIMTTWTQMVNGKVVNRIEDDEQHIRKVMGFPDNEDVVIEPLPEPGGSAKKPESSESTRKEERQKTEPRKLSETEQTVEMVAFAEETGGEWFELSDGNVVCMSSREA